MERARRHQRLLSVLAFALLALVAELVGRSLTQRIDIGRHVQSPGYAAADYYPFLLAGVKVGIALLLARLLWRVGRARAAARAARRLLVAVGHGPSEQAPRVRLRLSPRLWLAVFGLTSLIYLVQADAEVLSSGGGAMFDPWLHSSALPVFAVVAVAVAFLWVAVQRWLADYERYAARTVARARQVGAAAAAKPVHPAESSTATPRRLFGLAFESRPPPLTA
jgi:hypothetical protein